MWGHSLSFRGPVVFVTVTGPCISHVALVTVNQCVTLYIFFTSLFFIGLCLWFPYLFVGDLFIFISTTRIGSVLIRPFFVLLVTLHHHVDVFYFTVPCLLVTSLFLVSFLRLPNLVSPTLSPILSVAMPLGSASFSLVTLSLCQ
jgi:hypothetical protein